MADVYTVVIPRHLLSQLLDSAIEPTRRKFFAGKDCMREYEITSNGLEVKLYGAHDSGVGANNHNLAG